jgi:hypothetical protein
VSTDFSFEFRTNVPGADLLRTDVKAQLEELVTGHKDLTGASVALDRPPAVVERQVREQRSRRKQRARRPRHR